MPVTIHHVYNFKGSTLISADKLAAIVTNIVPAPLPSDLNITASDDLSLTVTFSLDHADVPTAAQAILNNFAGEPAT